MKTMVVQKEHIESKEIKFLGNHVILNVFTRPDLQENRISVGWD